MYGDIIFLPGGPTGSLPMPAGPSGPPPPLPAGYGLAGSSAAPVHQHDTITFTLQDLWRIQISPLTPASYPKGPSTIIVGIWAPKVYTIPLLGPFGIRYTSGAFKGTCWTRGRHHGTFDACRGFYGRPHGCADATGQVTYLEDHGT